MSNAASGREDGRTIARTLQLRVPPDPRYARTVRDAIVGFGRLHAVPHEDLSALLFAVGEAFANAIEHAGSGCDIDIAAEVDDERVIATVVDYGQGLASPPPGRTALPPVYAERGRGIPIMQRCTDLFEVHSTPGGGTAVTLGRYFFSNAERRTAS